mmetsp:Transcript_8243/g.24753  ORF Transcript_8243/g.24753 Transcript_8243/m.24753 type:complete len:236 (+) Transcript_8243:531-1238(+)
MARETSRTKFTPSSKVGKSMPSYSTHSGDGHILMTAEVMMPRDPSDPRRREVRSIGPDDTLPKADLCPSGVSFWDQIDPSAPTHHTLNTISSMLPYRFRFIPDALVAIHPPSVLNSIESGSCPIVYPRRAISSANAFPVMPASTRAHRSSSFTHSIRFIRRVSTEMTGRGSSDNGGGRRAWVTLVPPPKGMRTQSRCRASLTRVSISDSDEGQTTASGTRWVRWRVPERRRYTSS